MKVTITDLTPEEALKLFAYMQESGDSDDDTEEEKPKKKKKTKPVDDEEDDDDAEDDDDSDEADDDDDSGDDDGPTLAQVMAAFKKFLKKHKGDKKKAIPILKKFGVKSPNDLDESDYGKVLKLLAKG